MQSKMNLLTYEDVLEEMSTGMYALFKGFWTTNNTTKQDCKKVYVNTVLYVHSYVFCINPLKQIDCNSIWNATGGTKMTHCTLKQVTNIPSSKMHLSLPTHSSCRRHSICNRWTCIQTHTHSHNQFILF